MGELDGRATPPSRGESNPSGGVCSHKGPSGIVELMRKGLTRCLALLASSVLLALCTGLAPGTAAADSTDPGSDAEQTSSSSA